MNEEIKKKFKIAVIDDSEFSRKSIIEIIENEGFIVAAEAGSAEDAIRSALATKIHLFILDVVMPHIGGIELAKVLKEKAPDAYIIMVSSLSLESVIIESISTGAIDYLKKPFTPSDLIVAIENVVEICIDEKLLDK